jgi:hypothetical protein
MPGPAYWADNWQAVILPRFIAPKVRRKYSLLYKANPFPSADAIRTMAITPLSIVLRGGWRVAGRVTAVERVVCFRIGFDTGQRSQASAGWYISAFDVTAGKMSYSQLRNQFQAKNSMIFGLSHTHGCTKYSYFADQKHNPAPRAYHQLFWLSLLIIRFLELCHPFSLSSVLALREHWGYWEVW